MVGKRTVSQWTWRFSLLGDRPPPEDQSGWPRLNRSHIPTPKWRAVKLLACAGKNAIRRCDESATLPTRAQIKSEGRGRQVR